MRKWSLCICYFLPLVFHDWSLAEFLKASVVCTNPHFNNESREYCKAMDIALDVSIYVLIFHNFAGPYLSRTEYYAQSVEHTSCISQLPLLSTLSDNEAYIYTFE